jgi:nucleotide-binding universal stress UspA family protein
MPLHAQLAFLHVRISPGQAAPFTPHLDFARGPALREALRRLDNEAETRSAEAVRHVRQFCRRHGLALDEAPSPAPAVSATWREEHDDALGRLMRHARHNDLIVLGRAARSDGLPADLIEQLLLGCGRPVLIAPAQPRPSLVGTVLVCWQETAAAARALGAALPLLAASRRVVIASVEDGDGPRDDAAELARHLARRGIAAEALRIRSDGRPAAEQLDAAAASCDADLLVMGGYSHSRTRELLFGGCTQRFIAGAERPVLLMH